jgi:hypothetical protein
MQVAVRVLLEIVLESEMMGSDSRGLGGVLDFIRENPSNAPPCPPTLV